MTTQGELPFYNPRDRGKLNALRNIVATVTDELRSQEAVARGIVDFTTRELPDILRRNTPLILESSNHLNLEQISPYPFEISDFVQDGQRPEVFIKISDSINHQLKQVE